MAKSRLTAKERRRRACERAKKFYKENPDYNKNIKLKAAYGITLEEYNAFSTFCEGVCVICENKCPSGRRLAVDHDHKTGVIRGLLCINCNKGLGNFKDNTELLQKAISYLTAYKEAVEEQYAIDAEQEQKSISI